VLETTKLAKRIPGRDCLDGQDSLLGFRRRKKTIDLIETLTPWVILSSFYGSAGDEGYEPKDEF
jgi:hypothetical protein